MWAIRSAASFTPHQPSSDLSPDEMIHLIEQSPPHQWPAGWAHWENVNEAHRRLAANYIKTLAYNENHCSGKGIVIASGGTKYFPGAWVCVHVLRHLGCDLPIQLWHLGDAELDDDMKRLIEPLGVECVDALQVAKIHPWRTVGGWELKPYMIKHCPFREVLLLDADNIPVRDPSFLFDTTEYQTLGAILWPDFHEPGSPYLCRSVPPRVWEAFGVPFREEPPTESAQVVVDKGRCLREISLATWYAEHSDWSFQHVWGDTGCFHFGWRRLGSDFARPTKPPVWMGRFGSRTIFQHDFAGRWLFQHHCVEKWSYSGPDHPDPAWQHADVCLSALAELRSHWSGTIQSEDGASART